MWGQGAETQAGGQAAGLVERGEVGFEAEGEERCFGILRAAARLRNRGGWGGGGAEVVEAAEAEQGAVGAV